MQVLLPYANVYKSAKCLDNKRLNKQILEIIQILSANNNINVGWKIPKYIKNHPCSIMWKDDSWFLSKYLCKLLYEFYVRKNKFHKGVVIYYKFFDYIKINKNLKHLTPEFCKNMQELLLKKDYEYYSKYFIKGVAK